MTIAESQDKITPRLKFLIENLFERREAGWKDSLSQTKNAGTLEEVKQQQIAEKNKRRELEEEENE